MTDSESKHLQSLYRGRFRDSEDRRDEIWSVLCRHFFQRRIPPQSTVLDIGAGHCEFINNITADRRIAVDLNPDVLTRAAPGVQALVGRSDELAGIDDSTVDLVFISNFFEHVTRDTILSTLAAVKRVLRPGGRLMILQPNVRYCARDYWMFFDHITPVDDRALVEALEGSGYTVELNVPRFLPYTTKGHTPTDPRLVRLYLKVPLVWRVLGAQAFLVATPTPAGR